MKDLISNFNFINRTRCARLAARVWFLKKLLFLCGRQYACVGVYVCVRPRAYILITHVMIRFTCEKVWKQEG